MRNHTFQSSANFIYSSNIETCALSRWQCPYQQCLWPGNIFATSSSALLQAGCAVTAATRNHAKKNTILVESCWPVEEGEELLTNFAESLSIECCPSSALRHWVNVVNACHRNLSQAAFEASQVKHHPDSVPDVLSIKKLDRGRRWEQWNPQKYSPPIHHPSIIIHHHPSRTIIYCFGRRSWTSWTSPVPPGVPGRPGRSLSNAAVAKVNWIPRNKPIPPRASVTRLFGRFRSSKELETK